MTTKEFYVALLEELTSDELIREVNRRFKKLEVAAAEKKAKASKNQEEENAILHAVLTETPMSGDDIVNTLAEGDITWTKQKVAAVAKRLIEAGLVVKTPQIIEGRVYQSYSIVE